ncbi:ABC transporter ATP-binding protein [Photobacterium sp. DNB23_23_1]|uniref:ABC transporter ATP-binding protein n=1 Tax=Photobacterium pectinilyticum TaxID=2906793 RepID=A0ABT1N3E8_9GAMM|nr:ABC transporter ATP-binding protein [Photobacterium sp. ZSDE20]MCQ1059072.1 ABC transporter ATP-binding protein [Photobacterium sp. ZSDE20]MDD1824185.1 ABC transporter ATP-binding protein [Photobacterium sp. ZSDE20]
MDTLVNAHQLGKSYGKFRALMGVSFTIAPGQVLGILGHNGAGKSSLIKCLLGAHEYDGTLSVFGHEPMKERVAIVRDLAYLSDVAVLPEWMTVKQIVKYSAGVHPNFDRELATKYLSQTDIQLSTKIGRLSKGMKVQLHLALIMSADVRLLILDEPTLGLDLMFRERFYNQLVEWLNQGERSMIIASHEVDEVAHLLTDLLILKKGKTVMNGAVDELKGRFQKVVVSEENKRRAEAARPLYIQQGVKDSVYIFDNVKAEKLSAIGEVCEPSLSEVFIALQQEEV